MQRRGSLILFGLRTGDAAGHAPRGCEIFAQADQQARPFATVISDAYASGGVIEQVCAGQDAEAAPNVVSSNDSAPRPGAPIAVGLSKSARVN